MVIVDDSVMIRLNGKNVDYYEKKGYEIPRRKDKKGRMKYPLGTTISVKVEDLLISKVIVRVECDYKEDGCLGVVERPYFDVLDGRDVVPKDCCRNQKCKNKKVQEVNNVKYGVNYTFQLKEVQQKYKDTMIKRYGVPYPMQSELIQAKSVQTFIEHYGYESPMQSPIVQQKVKETNMRHFGVDSFSKTKQFKDSMSGENNPNWKGGVRSLNEYLRAFLYSWSDDHRKNNNYRCFISNTTSRSDLEVHHATPFNVIRDEILRQLGLPLHETIGDYESHQLIDIKNNLIEIHKDILGVPMRKELHTLFHKLYGHDEDVTYGDVLEFKKRYQLGEFDDVISTGRDAS